jgi:hypothetical protein
MARKFTEVFEVRHPFFRPAWRRALATAVCFLWAGFEMWNDAPIWAAVFAVAGGYLFWQFFVRFKPEDYEKHDHD